MSYTLIFENCTKLFVSGVSLFPPFEASPGSVGHGEAWADRFVLLSNHNTEGDRALGSAFQTKYTIVITHAVPVSETTDLTHR